MSLKMADAQPLAALLDVKYSLFGLLLDGRLFISHHDIHNLNHPAVCSKKSLKKKQKKNQSSYNSLATEKPFKKTNQKKKKTWVMKRQQNDELAGEVSQDSLGSPWGES